MIQELSEITLLTPQPSNSQYSECSLDLSWVATNIHSVFTSTSAKSQSRFRIFTVPQLSEN